jgi:hypothetical protein
VLACIPAILDEEEKKISGISLNRRPCAYFFHTALVSADRATRFGEFSPFVQILNRGIFFSIWATFSHKRISLTNDRLGYILGDFWRPFFHLVTLSAEDDVVVKA